MSRAHYKSCIKSFKSKKLDDIYNKISEKYSFNLEKTQRNAWREQIANLQNQLSAEYNEGFIIFEFTIPRLGKRIDVILLLDGIVFVLEYKVGATSYNSKDIGQVVDYALNLKNCHEESHDRYIVPILISTKASFKKDKDNEIQWAEDKVAACLLSDGSNLGGIISRVLEEKEIKLNNKRRSRRNSCYTKWINSSYKPTTSIIEEARILFAKNDVKEILNSEAGTKNIDITLNCIEKIIAESKENKKKSICFLTGVPGSGKTLVGLNISARTIDASSKDRAVFLSGNTPLVSVLRKALTELKNDDQSTRESKKDVRLSVNTLIQNIHHFRDEENKKNEAPNERIVIFDEAQRAWNEKQTKAFLKKKDGNKASNASEPEILIEAMDKHNDWCTVVCLIGEGQEIHTGEDGLKGWLKALQKDQFSSWDIYRSGQIADECYAEFRKQNYKKRKKLHLSTSFRSFRGKKLSDFVDNIINGKADGAKEVKKCLNRYPLFLTRDLNVAKIWLRDRTRGSERTGLVASSGALRLKPEGIYIKSKVNPVHWFLSGKEDVRSSYCFEDVATEFTIQGLELDWIGVCWDANFRMQKSKWNYHNFRGTNWENIKSPDRRTYLRNAYRVLLTRARQGMVIFIPQGCCKDRTRLPEFYNGTYDFLKECGIKEI